MNKRLKNSIGMSLDGVKLAPYNPLWAEIFEHNKARIEEILKGQNVRIEHIGSTSIPTVRVAKPVIDIGVVANREQAPLICHKISSQGLYSSYDGIPSLLPDGYHIEVLDGPLLNATLVNYIHMDSKIDEKLRFKRFLIEHPELAEEYATIKEKSVIKCAGEIKCYSKEKKNFITDINKMALDLYGEKP